MATLLGVLITQTFKSVGETRRRRHEASSRWHVENYRVRAAIVTKATAVERSLYSAASMLDDSEREPRMPGTKSILLSPKEGIEGLFDRITRAILVEAVEDGFKVLDESYGRTGHHRHSRAGRDREAAGRTTARCRRLLEMFAQSSLANAELLAMRDARESFAEAAATTSWLLPNDPGDPLRASHSLGSG